MEGQGIAQIGHKASQLLAISLQFTCSLFGLPALIFGFLALSGLFLQFLVHVEMKEIELLMDRVYFIYFVLI